MHLPKTTDEIRVKTNPKVSYEGRIISGQHIAKPGKVGAMQKKLPDRSHPLGPDRWFTTTGNVTGNTQRPAIVMKYVNRKTTEKKSRIGPAAPVNGKKFKQEVKLKFLIKYNIRVLDLVMLMLEKNGVQKVKEITIMVRKILNLKIQIEWLQKLKLLLLIETKEINVKQYVINNNQE